MNRAVPDEVVEEVRSRTDIIELIGNYVPLKHAGSTWKGCCPFHQEKTPSFTVNQQRQRYHCFGCGKGGDAFKFIMEIEGVDFPTAIHMLASRCGVIIPEKPAASPQEAAQMQASRNRKERLFELHSKLSQRFAEQLWSFPESQVSQYFQTRQLPEDIARKFGIGAAPDSWDSTLEWGRQQGFNIDELLDGGVVVPSDKNPSRFYDRFRNRLVFPIWDEQGRVVAFSARTVQSGDTEGAKYVNSPETPIFKKSNVLYALCHARQAISQKNFAILCEGQLDVIAMHRAGFTNAVAPQGTAFTYEQAKMLHKYCKTVYLCFDADNAGQKAAVRALEILLPLEFEVKVIALPGGKDPDELLKNSGPEPIAEAVTKASDFFDFVFSRKNLEHDRNSPVGKTRIVNDLLQLLQMVANSVTRSLYVNKLSSLMGLNEQAVFNELNRFRHQEKYERHPGNNQQQSAAPEPNAAALLDIPTQIRHAEQSLLKVGLISAEAAQRLTTELPMEQITATPIGQALNELIRLTVAGDWETLQAHLNDWEREHPDPELSSILAETGELEPQAVRKAVDDCLKTIVGYHVDQQAKQIMAKIQQAATPEEKQTLMKELMSLRRPAGR